MDEDKVFSLYEKYYFHEFDSRDKLVARLQLSLAILTAVVGFAVYLVAKVDIKGAYGSGAIFAFWFPLVVSAVCMLRACQWYLRALWGHTYECVPLASEMEKHRRSLVAYYEGRAEGLDSARSMFRKALLDYYIDCSSRNASINAGRYLNIHYSIRALVCSLPPLGFAALTGFATGIVKSTS